MLNVDTALKINSAEGKMAGAQIGVGANTSCGH